MASYKTPLFNGDERNFEMWEVKFLGLMRLKGLHPIVQGTDNDADKNAEAFAELIQCLDDRSLSLIMRDAKDDGISALKILREHYLPKGKPRIITLYTELTSLRLEKEMITDFIIRAETIASQLRDAKEIISDGLLIAMIMKALPNRYKAFSAVINQKEDNLTFSEFKMLLRNYEDQEKVHNSSDTASSSTSVMSMSSNPYQQNQLKYWCSHCRSKSHNTNQCYKKPQSSNFNPKQHYIQNQQQSNSRYCTRCKNHTHDTKFCRNIRRSQHQSAKSLTTTEEDSTNFTFHIAIDDFRSKQTQLDFANSLLIDSGATTHILTSTEKFNKFNKSFDPQSHIVQLADGSKARNVVEGMGDATIELNDEFGESREIKLKDVLFIPSFDQDIFSVPAATNDGALVNFSETSGSIQMNGFTFGIQKSKSLYYLNSARKANIQRSGMTFLDIAMYKMC